jgi:hypothetical protein
MAREEAVVREEAVARDDVELSEAFEHVVKHEAFKVDLASIFDERCIPEPMPKTTMRSLSPRRSWCYIYSLSESRLAKEGRIMFTAGISGRLG